MPLTMMMYYSRSVPRPAQGPSSLETLREILKISETNNRRDGLTGFLLFDSTWFIQILEGETRALSATYRRIERDPRHRDPTIMMSRTIGRRTFPRWSMAGKLRTPAQQEIFLRHGVSDALDPMHLTGPTLLALAMDLQDVRPEVDNLPAAVAL